jgi:hypothetical protein
MKEVGSFETSGISNPATQRNNSEERKHYSYILNCKHAKYVIIFHIVSWKEYFGPRYLLFYRVLTMVYDIWTQILFGLIQS